MSELTINTTQNVNINFEAATVGERVLAYLVDFLVKASYVFLLFLIFIILLNLGSFFNSIDFWTGMAIYSVLSLPIVFYSLLFESLMEGQTIGKRVMKIKVVKIDGYQASFGDYLIRWVVRIVDIGITSGIIGLIAMIVNDKTQRLGDVAAGTAVITLKNKVTINSSILEDIGEMYVPTYPLVIKLTDNDVRIIKETLHTALSRNDLDVIVKLKEKIESVTGIKNQSGKSEDFIRIVIKDYNYYTQNM